MYIYVCVCVKKADVFKVSDFLKIRNNTLLSWYRANTCHTDIFSCK